MSAPTPRKSFASWPREGKLDILLTASTTDGSGEYVSYTSPYVTAIQMLYVREGLPPVDSVDDLYGLRFAVPRGFFAEDVLASNPRIDLVHTASAGGSGQGGGGGAGGCHLRAGAGC